MFISLHMSPQSRSEAEDIARIEEAVEMAVIADRAGISSICLTEHHLAGFNSYCDPLAFGMYLAGKLEQAYIAISIVQLPMQHPVRIAEQCNLLDVATRGRALIGFAPGAVRPIELDTFGVPVEKRSDMTAQRLDAMLKAWGWTEEDAPLDVSTDYDTGVLAGRLTPSSYRKPHPLIARASETPATLAATAQRGMPALLSTPNAEHARVYLDALEAAGHDDETVADCLDWLGFVTMASLAPTMEQALARMQRYVEGGGSRPVVKSGGASAQAWVREWHERQVSKKDWAIPATPESLVEEVLGQREMGVNHARISLAEIPGEDEQNMETFRMFVEDVLPQLDPQRLRDPARTVLSEQAAALGGA